jgi:transcriptional regulator with XRE-family HTH domain
MSAKTPEEVARELAICSRVKQAREARMLSQAEVARTLGIKLHRYAKWEVRSSPPPYWIPQLCLILGVPAWWLLTGQKRPPEWQLRWYRFQGVDLQTPSNGDEPDGTQTKLSA